MKENDIPIFKFDFIDDFKHFLKSSDELIYNMIYEVLDTKADKDFKEIDVFAVVIKENKSSFTITVKHEGLDDSIDKAIKYYESIENYEICQKFKDLADSFNS